MDLISGADNRQTYGVVIVEVWVELGEQMGAVVKVADMAREPANCV